jgi:membrane-bound metal-dependent hydrolase YbcI (DUF457 family)
MPSPIGHLLAGAGAAWAVGAVTRLPLSSRLVVTCAALGGLPDADLLIRGTHRTASHSVAAVAAILIVAAAVTGRVTRWRTALACAAAYASHLLLDWLGVDRYPPAGIQLLWPWSDAWYISGWNIFNQTLRQQVFTAPVMRQNMLAIAQELAILLPLVYVIWIAARRRSRSRDQLDRPAA